MDTTEFSIWYKGQLKRCADAKVILGKEIYYKVLGREFGKEHANELKMKDLEKFLRRLRYEYRLKKRREDYATDYTDENKRA